MEAASPNAASYAVSLTFSSRVAAQASRHERGVCTNDGISLANA